MLKRNNHYNLPRRWLYNMCEILRHNQWSQQFLHNSSSCTVLEWPRKSPRGNFRVLPYVFKNGAWNDHNLVSSSSPISNNASDLRSTPFLANCWNTVIASISLPRKTLNMPTAKVDNTCVGTLHSKTLIPSSTPARMKAPRYNADSSPTRTIMLDIISSGRFGSCGLAIILLKCIGKWMWCAMTEFERALNRVLIKKQIK